MKEILNLGLGAFARVDSLRSAQALQRFDAIGCRRMCGEKTAAAAFAAGLALDPLERTDQVLLRGTGAVENIDRMAVRRRFFAAAKAGGDERAGDRCDRAAAREQLLEQNDAKVETKPQGLKFRDMPQLLMGDLMPHDAAKLLVVRLLEQPSGYIKLSAAGVGGIDIGIVHDADVDLFRILGVIHRLE